MVHRLARLSPFGVLLALALALAACAGGASEGTPGAGGSGEAIKVGFMYDGTGPIRQLGIPYKTGFEDYVKLVNSRGGIDGHLIEISLCEHGYEVPRGVQCYERHKAEGMPITFTLSTPLSAALVDRCNADKIVCSTPGFGPSETMNGEKYPYIFPQAAGWWSQVAGAVQFVLEQWQRGDNEGRPKVAYLYTDNPAGREPLEALKAIVQREGITYQPFAFPLGSVDLTVQVSDIAQRFRADWTIVHATGASGSAAIKAFRQMGYPMDRVVWLYLLGEDEVTGAGGWQVAEGVYLSSWSATGIDQPILEEIRRMYQEQGGSPSREMETSTTWYLRGVAVAAIWAEGLRKALENDGWPLTGEKVKRGMESVRGELALGVVRLEMSPRDHEGGGFVTVYQAKDGKWVQAKDWFRAYRDIIQSLAYK